MCVCQFTEIAMTIFLGEKNDDFLGGENGHFLGRFFFSVLQGEGNPGWKKSHPLSKRLASLGIMGAQLKASLKPLNTTVL